MKKIFVFLIAINLVFYNFLLAYSTNPKDFVEELVNDAIEKLANKDLTKKKNQFCRRSKALNNVDINALGLLHSWWAKKIFKWRGFKEL